MKTKIILSVVALALMISTFGQKHTLELTFTAIYSTSYVQLDSIKVMNRTQGGDTVLYWPDTVLILYLVGIAEINKEGEVLQIFQNYPNPVKDQTTITLYVPKKDKVGVMISDMLGRKVINTERVLERGYHSFKFTPGGEKIYFFTAFWQGTSSSIKILHAATGPDRSGSLEYLGRYIAESHLKSVNNVQSFEFNPGDELLYIGFTDTLQSGLLDAPETSETYTFQFATNTSCPGTPTVTYEGQVYNTIQIFSQCWLKENLNVGTMIPGNQEMEDNEIIEKYCYDNDSDNCVTYGGLYQWTEMMQYTTQNGTQGICPPGWHLPTDEEWKVLDGAVDSQYGIGNPTWDDWGFRGFDAGTNLKSTSGWYGGGNGNDLFGFSGRPGGYHLGGGNFFVIGDYGGWWSSTEYNNDRAWSRGLSCYSSEVDRDNYDKEFGFSVRCVRDYSAI
ncbi:MAG: hypothetical protein IMY70_01805 [Bacteroidetes bacterium]|nr:hypothetical protein [Bacteroidota bacterium]